MEYKGYTIDVSVFPDMMTRTFHAVYTIRRGSDEAQTVIMPGGISELDTARTRAEQAACHWVDKQVT
jgi:hypothetical protein